MENLSNATREIMWNVPFGWLMYPLFVLSLISLTYGFYRHISRWRAGSPDDTRLSEYPARLLFGLKEVLLQTKVWRFSIAGFFHSLFFYSFIVFVVTTAVIGLDYDFGTNLYRGLLYSTLTVLSDLAGLLFLFGLGMAIWRRTITRPVTLTSDSNDVVALGLLMLIVITGFSLEGLRISLTGDQWASLSPVGFLTSGLFSGLSKQGGLTLHAGIWWIHTLLVMVWIASIPYTNFLHLLIIPANAFFAKRSPAGELTRIDLEALMEQEDFDPDDFSIGLGTTDHLTWKQRLSLDACVSCGRCDDICPAFAAGLPLSPKQFIAGMKGAMMLNHINQKFEVESSGTEIVGNAFDEMLTWHCRTCRACDEVCPAYVEHVDTQIEIRRSEVNMNGRMPEELEQMLRQMETNGNPFGHQKERVRWTESLEAPIIGPGESCDVLYWIGCLSTFDSEKQQIAEGVLQYLKNSGVSYGILGVGEVCCGDPARIAGEENLFQTTAKQQVEELKQRQFKILLTSCPHCFNVLKNEYPQFGGEFQVMHHTEYLQANGVTNPQPSPSKPRTVFYHDPCYLGRYQGIYEAPRAVLKELPDLKMAELDKSGWKSFCCGAGGGHFWMDIKGGERINNLRVQQIKEAGADTIVTACPFCHHMLEDSIKLLNLEDELQVMDIISLAQESPTDQT